MKPLAIFKTEQLHGGCFLRVYPKISRKERLARWIKRVHGRTNAHGRPLRIQLPLRIMHDQQLPDTWVSLHADGVVVHISTVTKIGQAS